MVKLMKGDRLAFYGYYYTLERKRGEHIRMNSIINKIGKRRLRRKNKKYLNIEKRLYERW